MKKLSSFLISDIMKRSLLASVFISFLFFITGSNESPENHYILRHALVSAIAFGFSIFFFYSSPDFRFVYEKIKKEQSTYIFSFICFFLFGLVSSSMSMILINYINSETLFSGSVIGTLNALSLFLATFLSHHLEFMKIKLSILKSDKKNAKPWQNKSIAKNIAIDFDEIVKKRKASLPLDCRISYLENLLLEINYKTEVNNKTPKSSNNEQIDSAVIKTLDNIDLLIERECSEPDHVKSMSGDVFNEIKLHLSKTLHNDKSLSFNLI